MLIGSLQWPVTLGLCGVQYATNFLAKFSQQPREVHMNIAFSIFGYLNHHLRAKISCDT